MIESEKMIYEIINSDMLKDHDVDITGHAKIAELWSEVKKIYSLPPTSAMAKPA